MRNKFNKVFLHKITQKMHLNVYAVINDSNNFAPSIFLVIV